MAGSGIAPGVVGRRYLNGPLDGNSVPVDEFDATHEGRMVKARNGLRNDVLAMTVLEARLHAKGKKCRHLRELRRQNVIGVQIPHRSEDFRHLVVERDLAAKLRLRQPPLQKSQALKRVDRMHCALEAEMHVKSLEQLYRLLHHKIGLTRRESIDVREKISQPNTAAEGALD